MRFKEWYQIEEGLLSGFRYGNFCGPGPYLDKKTCGSLTDGSPPPEPIDAVDAGCKQHDIDYCKCGANSMSGVIGFGNACTKQADQRLISNMKQQLQSGQLSDGAVKAAKMISGYFGAHNKVMDFRNWVGGLFGGGNNQSQVAPEPSRETPPPVPTTRKKPSRSPHYNVSYAKANPAGYGGVAYA
jgi:hypothetical protein